MHSIRSHQPLLILVFFIMAAVVVTTTFVVLGGIKHRNNHSQNDEQQHNNNIWGIASPPTQSPSHLRSPSAAKETAATNSSSIETTTSNSATEACPTSHYGHYFDPNEDSNGPWPSCICATGEACKIHILELAPSLQETNNIFVIPWNAPVTKDYRTDRVRIFVDDFGIVYGIPKRG